MSCNVTGRLAEAFSVRLEWIERHGRVHGGHIGLARSVLDS
jgi:hypothetical protein